MTRLAGLSAGLAGKLAGSAADGYGISIAALKGRRLNG